MSIVSVILFINFILMCFMFCWGVISTDTMMPAADTGYPSIDMKTISHICHFLGRKGPSEAFKDKRWVIGHLSKNRPLKRTKFDNQHRRKGDPL